MDISTNPVELLSFNSPESKSIQKATYDTSTRTLTIYFKRGPTHVVSYIFDNFPRMAEKGANWEGFKGAESKGTYFQRNIRAQFPGKPVAVKR